MADEYPPGNGPLPGSGEDKEQRRRRRGALPGGEGRTEPPPLSTGPAPAAEGDLAMTAKQKLPEPKVWGLRVSESHYDTARTMTNVLATRYRLDQRQVGELIIQFLVQNRFALDEYVANQVGPAIDLDFFTKTQS
ncbi:hypothetical protein [Amycolatopsis keratiniphila]|uniref:hypothetical protein n=1 Tax=Amycolatopsis keratiniphila TaxID=129921 RepID=UPI000F506BE8|nr:hypothetical protein [Amycolatopsis keratiniphila]